MQIETLRLLAKALGVEYDTLLAGAAKRFSVTFTITATYEPEFESLLGDVFEAMKALGRNRIELTTPQVARGSILLTLAADEGELPYYFAPFRIISQRVEPQVGMFTPPEVRPSDASAGFQLAAQMISVPRLRPWQRARVWATAAVTKALKTRRWKTYSLLAGVRQIAFTDSHTGETAIAKVELRVSYRTFCEVMIYDRDWKPDA